MARAIWTGSVSFGLVNVPVGLFSATQRQRQPNAEGWSSGASFVRAQVSVA